MVPTTPTPNDYLEIGRSCRPMCSYETRILCWMRAHGLRGPYKMPGMKDPCPGQNDRYFTAKWGPK